jgi:FHA domain
MAICPSGHESASEDYCDVCGALIGTAVLTGFTAAPGAMAPGAMAPGAMPGQAPGVVSPAEDACPRCGVPRVGQFCESCGFDFSAARAAAGTAAARPPVPPVPPAPPAPPVPPTAVLPQAQAPAPPPVPAPPPPAGNAVWGVVVTADRAYYDSVQDAGGADAAVIGFPAYCPERRFRLAGTEVRVGRRSESRGIHPEIDLTGPPADPGVSRLHVVLVAAPDGTWSVVDPGSANGTLVNGDEIPAGQTVPLRDGDVIHLGAWTALTLTRT